MPGFHRAFIAILSVDLSSGFDAVAGDGSLETHDSNRRRSPEKQKRKKKGKTLEIDKT